MGPQAGRAIVLPAGRQRRRVKGVNAGPVGGRNRDMDGAADRPSLGDPQERLGSDAIAHLVGQLFAAALHHDPRDAERRQRLVIEGKRAPHVAHRNAHMIQHGYLPKIAGRRRSPPRLRG